MFKYCYNNDRQPVLYDYRCVTYDFPKHDTEHELSDMGDYMILVTLDDGLTLIRSENERHLLKKNSLVFLRKSEPFCFINDNDFTVSSFYITYDYKSLENFVADFRPNKVIHNCFNLRKPFIMNLSTSTVAEIRKNLLNCFIYASDFEFSNTYGEYLLSYFFINILSSFKPEQTLKDSKTLLKPVPPWFSNELSKLVNSNEIFSATAEHIAEKMHISTRHLSRLMQKYFGMTTSQYITSVKMKTVANELITTNKKVIDIMSEVGYSNISWANEQFKLKYGVTPSQYRSEYFK